MYRPLALIVVVALAAGACAETPDDSNDAGAADTSSFDAMVPAPGDSAPADVSGADGSDSGSTDGTAGATATTIPSRFHGEWNADRSACGTGRSETRLRISADEIRFYESVGAVESVSIEGDRRITVTAEYTGEGQTWQDERRLTLSPDDASLTVSGGAELVRYRCP